MIQRRPLSIFLLFVLVLSAAFVLQKAIYRLVIIPLAYVWWLLTLYYHLIPQLVIWVVLIFVILFITVRGLLMEIPVEKKIVEKKKVYPGPVDSLSLLVQKSSEGVYYKWLIAHRLGNVARELLDQREGRQIKQKFTRLEGRGWNPPEDVASYLDTGVNGSFADYPHKRWSRVQHTPLDVSPKQVIEYLESEMENSRNGHR